MEFDEEKGMLTLTAISAIESNKFDLKASWLSFKNFAFIIFRIAYNYSLLDYYRILGVTPMATFEELKAAHIQLGNIHVDSFEAQLMFYALHNAYFNPLN